MLDLKSIRTTTSLASVLLYLFIGMPLWYKLTTIYRANLPYEKIESLHSNIFQDIHMKLPIYLHSTLSTFSGSELHEGIRNSFRQKLQDSLINWDLEFIKTWPAEQGLEQYAVNVISDSTGVDKVELDYESKNTTIHINDASDKNTVCDIISNALINKTFNIEAQRLSSLPNLIKNDAVSISYNPNVHLTISVLSGDGNPIAWEIDQTLKKTFTPLRHFLAPLINFTVDTEIVYYNDLNLHTLNDIENVTSSDLSHIIDLSEISNTNYFENSAGLNLVMIFPSKKTAPNGLTFINEQETGSVVRNWKGFLLPQWGFLVVNKYPFEKNSLLKQEYLEPVINSFSEDLLKLLGYIKPNHYELEAPLITINSFKRVHIFQNLEKSIDTLFSLIKLAKQFEQMSIPKEVYEDVKKSLEIREEIINYLNNPQVYLKKLEDPWEHALKLSNEMVSLSESAFFHGEMVQQNFFPQEHKIAVYLPMLGPLTLMVVSSILKIFKEKPIEGIQEDIDEDKRVDKKEHQDESWDEKEQSDI